jgi:hypothetical protein
MIGKPPQYRLSDSTTIENEENEPGDPEKKAPPR